MKNKPADETIGDLVKQKRHILFQVAKMVLRDPEMVLDELIENELCRAVIRWSARTVPTVPVGLLTKNSSDRKKLFTALKNLRRYLIRREAEKTSLWIEQSGIRHSWPELPEYRIRRLAIRGLLRAFRLAGSIADFHRRAPFSVKQIMWKTASNSPHCWCFRINLETGKSACTRGTGEVFQ